MKFEDEQAPEWREWNRTYGGHDCNDQITARPFRAAP